MDIEVFRALQISFKSSLFVGFKRIVVCFVVLTVLLMYQFTFYTELDI